MYQHLNVVGDHVMIPTQAFLFKPFRQQNPQFPDDFKRYEGGEKFRRLLFQGWAQNTYTPLEIKKLQQFEQFLQEENVKLDKRWNRSWRLRWILSTGYNFKKSLEDIRKFQGYQQRVRQLSFTHKIAENLRAGMFYMVGRDCHYRPIVVIDAEKIISSEISQQQCLQTQIYFFEYVMRHCFIPGQVESWVALIDSNYQSFFNLMGAVKTAFTFLSDTYRMRLYSCYNCRINFPLRMMWSIVQKFLDPQTINKIHLFEDLNPQPMFSHVNRSQVQEKFGGILPNLQEGQFWPPRMEVSSYYKVPKDEVKLMTRQQYTQYYEKGILFDTRIHQQVIIKKVSTQMRQNKNKKTIKQLQKRFERQFDQLQSDKIDLPYEMKMLQKFKKPLNYFQLLKKDKNFLQTTKTQTK